MTKNSLRGKGTIALARTPAKILGLALCLSLMLPISHAFAVTNYFSRPTADPRIDKLKGDLEYVSKQEAAEVQKYIALKAESQKAEADLASINKKIRDAEARQKSAQDQAASARAEFAAAQERYDLAVKDSETAHDRRSKAIVRLYQESSDPDAIPSMLSAGPEERQDIIRKTSLMENFNDKQTAVISDADIKASEAIQERMAHEDARIRAEAAEKIAADEEISLGPLHEQYAAAQKKAKANETAEKAIVDSLKSKKAGYNRQIAQITAESNALAAQIRKKQNSNVVVAPGKMRRPVGAAINSPYGYRVHPIYGDSRLHAGVDFNASYGTAIAAAKAGKVIYASQMSGYGNVIIIDHGGGISTLYAHQSSFAVSLGAVVSQGKTIGYVGATGNVTGPHLHFEVRVNGAPVNPMPYF